MTEPTRAPALEARGLTKHFPVGSEIVRGPGRRRRLHAVDDVSLALWPGRTTALVGESGSGKSTLARVLMGLYRPTAGDVLLDGSPVALRRRSVRRRYTGDVQMILQDPFASLNPVHTIRYQLSRPMRNHPSGEGTQGGLERLLDEVQLTPSRQYLDKRPHELSGGQRQRVAIARALAARPRVLLADEPVSMLDVSIRLGVLNLLDRLRESLDLAVLYITHDIASARYFSDDIAVMYAAEAVEAGPAEQVTQHPAHPYTRLLISAAPDPGRPRTAAARRTELPDLTDPPVGCRFAARCPHAMARCRTASPGWTDLGDGHRVRCFLYPDARSRDDERPGA